MVQGKREKRWCSEGFIVRESGLRFWSFARSDSIGIFQLETPFHQQKFGWKSTQAQSINFDSKCARGRESIGSAPKGSREGFKRRVQENGGHLGALLGGEHRWLGEPRRLRKRTKISVPGNKKLLHASSNTPSVR